MKIIVNVKQIGKKRNSIEKREYNISDNIKNIEEFIKNIVTLEVEKFNKRIDEIDLIDFITESKIEDDSIAGKISFNKDYNGKTQDLKSAVENANQSYIDGIYCIFLNNNRLSENINEKLEIKENDEFTFVRLAMLSGRMW